MIREKESYNFLTKGAIPGIEIQKYENTSRKDRKGWVDKMIEPFGL